MPDPAPWQRRLPNQLTCLRLALAAAFIGLLLPFHANPFGNTWREEDQAVFDPYLPALAAFAFVLAALTDALDGHLARKWNVVSTFGRVMDPFADKFLVLSAFILLLGPGFIWQWSLTGTMTANWLGMRHSAWLARYIVALPVLCVVVIVAREVLVSSLRGIIEGRGVDFSASTSGKLKMVVQSVAIPLILLLVAWNNAGLGVAAIAPTVATREGLSTIAAIGPWFVLVFTTLVTLWSAVPYVTRAIKTLRAPAMGA